MRRRIIQDFHPCSERNNAYTIPNFHLGMKWLCGTALRELRENSFEIQRGFENTMLVVLGCLGFVSLILIVYVLGWS